MDTSTSVLLLEISPYACQGLSHQGGLDLQKLLATELRSLLCCSSLAPDYPSWELQRPCSAECFSPTHFPLTSDGVFFHDSWWRIPHCNTESASLQVCCYHHCVAIKIALRIDIDDQQNNKTRALKCKTLGIKSSEVR